MEILQLATIPEHLLEPFQEVHRAVFEGQSLKENKLAQKNNLLVLFAVAEGQIAGFKLGYEIEPGVFYSWLGGVAPSFQGRGIAKQLMEKQHMVVKHLGYHTVRTYSRNERRAMLLLNIKSGFHIIDTFVDKKGQHKIRLEKSL